MSTPKQKTSAPSHTPGPWRHARTGNILDWRGCTIASIHEMPGQNTNEKKGNAEFIVRACNSHDALVSALQNLIQSDFSRCQALQEKADKGDSVAKAIIFNAWAANEQARTALVLATPNK